MKEDLIDDLDDDLIAKQASDKGNRFRINRYIISYPFKDELQIAQQKSIKMFPIIVVTVVGGMGGFFLFLTGYYFIESGFAGNAASIMCLFFAAIMLGITIFTLVQHYASSRTFTFEKDAFVYRGLFKSKKIILREDVRSVFLKETIVKQGSTSTYRYSVCLKTPELNTKEGVYEMFEVDLKYPIKTLIKGKDHEVHEKAKIECKHICEVISEHWNIPVSI